MGDFNAHVKGYGGAQETNTNGEWLLEMTEYWGLEILNNPADTTMRWKADQNKTFCVDYTIASRGIKVMPESWKVHPIEEFHSDH